MRVMAGVVTFNPDLSRLRENLAAISGQVDAVLLVDNASSRADELRGVCCQFDSVTVLRNDLNRGMSAALNQLMGSALERGAEHVLLLDQDSVAEPGMVAALLDEVAPGVALVGAYVLDRNLEDAPPGDDEVA